MARPGEMRQTARWAARHLDVRPAGTLVGLWWRHWQIARSAGLTPWRAAKVALLWCRLRRVPPAEVERIFAAALAASLGESP